MNVSCLSVSRNCVAVGTLLTRCLVTYNDFLLCHAQWSDQCAIAIDIKVRTNVRGSFIGSWVGHGWSDHGSYNFGRCVKRRNFWSGYHDFSFCPWHPDNLDYAEWQHTVIYLDRSRSGAILFADYCIIEPTSLMDDCRIGSYRTDNNYVHNEQHGFLQDQQALRVDWTDIILLSGPPFRRAWSFKTRLGKFLRLKNASSEPTRWTHSQESSNKNSRACQTFANAP